MKIEINKAPNLLTNGFVKTSGSDGSLGVDTNTYLTSVGTGVANEITYWSGTNALGSLATATYPSLTELSYVKGVTSAIQTQLNAKGTYTLPSLTSGSVLVSNGTTIVQDNANFFYDTTNHRLHVGSKQTGTGTLNVSNEFRVVNSATANYAVKLLSNDTATAISTLAYGQQDATANSAGGGYYFNIKNGLATYPFWASDVGVGIYTNANPTSLLQVAKNVNSVTQSDVNGLLLSNSTAAISGTQSISPVIVQQGNYWNTTATADSRDIRFRTDVLPVEGVSTVGTLHGYWRLAANTNGGGYGSLLTVDDLGGTIFNIARGTGGNSSEFRLNVTDQFATNIVRFYNQG